jgi:hypothetical protein
MLDKDKPMKSLKILDDSNATSFHFLIFSFVLAYFTFYLKAMIGLPHNFTLLNFIYPF